MQRPIGPVAVFGASNFPLAFSTAGGDTAAALAAGCPVVVKGHSAHPGTGEIVADAILAAITGPACRKVCSASSGWRLQGRRGARHASADQGCRLYWLAWRWSCLVQSLRTTPGTDSFLRRAWLGQSDVPAAGSHENPRAVAGRRLGRVLDHGCRSVLHQSGHRRGYRRIGRRQLCAVHPQCFGKVAPQVMLTDGIAGAYQDGKVHFDSRNSVKAVLTTESKGREASPNLYETTGDAFLSDHTIGKEVFGPLGIVVRVKSVDDMVHLAKGLEGQLTATLHMDRDDAADARKLLPVLERKAGRVLANGFPTGVEVVGSMVHGGPYPASTNFGATSVGTMSMRRFLRPVSYQNIPADVLPTDFE